MSVSEISALATELARSQMRDWDERVRRADERIYGWKSIAAEVERLKGVPCSTKTVRRWWKGRRMPIDTDPIGISITRWELERWLRSRPLPAARAG